MGDLLAGVVLLTAAQPMLIVARPNTTVAVSWQCRPPLGIVLTAAKIRGSWRSRKTALQWKITDAPSPARFFHIDHASLFRIASRSITPLMRLAA
jgi:hypothetical protein